MQAIVDKKTGECIDVTPGEYKLTGLPPGCAPVVVPPGFEIVTLSGDQAEWGWRYDVASNALVPDDDVRAEILMTTVDAKTGALKDQLADIQTQLDALGTQADAITAGDIQAAIDVATGKADAVSAVAADALEADPAPAVK